MSFVPTAAAVFNQWLRILGALEKKINRQSFETWLKPTRFARVVDKTLYVRIPSAQFEHIGEKYGQLIEEAIEKLDLQLIGRFNGRADEPWSIVHNLVPQRIGR